MIHSPSRALVGVLAAGLLLAGCSGDPDPVGTSPSASASAQPSASPSPSPTSTLTAEEQQAFEEATKVVLAYRQTITDLYSGARTNLNDLNEVAAGEQRRAGPARTSSRASARGGVVEPEGAQFVLVSAEPVEVNLDDDPDTVVVARLHRRDRRDRASSPTGRAHARASGRSWTTRSPGPRTSPRLAGQ